MGMKVIKENILINPYNLPEEYQSDFIEDIDLSNCCINGIKEELKLFIYKNKEKKCLNKHISCLIEFLNKECYNADSILYFNIEELDSKYLYYLENKGEKIYYEVKRLLYSSMNEVDSKNKTTIACLLKKFYNFIKIYENNLNPKILNRDIWDLNNFVFKLDTEHTKVKSLNFESIKQEEMKRIVKNYIYKKLQTKHISTCYSYLIIIKNFCEFLYINYNDLKDFENINYDIVEDYFLYLTTEKEIGHNRRSEYISNIETFLNYTMFMEWQGSLKKQIIFDFDKSCNKVLKPRYLTDEEIKNLNSHLSDMPLNLMRMVITLENVGMRIIECCLLKQDCLRTDANNKHYLKYYQYKTDNSNIVPISEDIYLTIKAAINDAQDLGNFEYVFLDNNKPFNYNHFYREINKICYQYKIKNKDGNILHIQTHMFRGTLATKYIDMGLPIEVIRKLLGQKGLGSIYHYIEGNEANLIDTFEPIMNERATMIENIGKKDFMKNIEEIDKEFLPLSNGYCSKKISTGICDRANNCFECAMFKPTKQHYDVYINQLNRLKANIKIAEVNGFERQIQINKRTYEALLKIIKTINPNFQEES